MLRPLLLISDEFLGFFCGYSTFAQFNVNELRKDLILPIYIDGKGSSHTKLMTFAFRHALEETSAKVVQRKSSVILSLSKDQLPATSLITGYVRIKVLSEGGNFAKSGLVS
jgi:hypothetical protein